MEGTQEAVPPSDAAAPPATATVDTGVAQGEPIGTALEGQKIAGEAEIGRESMDTEEAKVSGEQGNSAVGGGDNVEGENMDVNDVDSELEAMKKRLQQMEAESLAMKPEGDNAGKEAAAGEDGKDETPQDEKLVAAAAAAARAAVKEVNGGRGSNVAVDEAVADADSRSIYVGNVDYSATGTEIESFFSECGTINRVTIMSHKPTGQPKGFAYVEFQDQLAAQNALILNQSTFKGRKVTILPKRTNYPGVSRGRGRGRYMRGRGYYYPRRPRGIRGRGRRGRWAPPPTQ